MPRSAALDFTNEFVTTGDLSPDWVETRTCRNLEEMMTMKNIAQRVRRFLVSEVGPTAVDYAFILPLIIIVGLVPITSGEPRAGRPSANAPVPLAGPARATSLLEIGPSRSRGGFACLT